MEILPIIKNQLRKRNSYDDEAEWSKRIRFAQKFYDSLDSLNISDRFDFEKKFSKINVSTEKLSPKKKQTFNDSKF